MRSIDVQRWLLIGVLLSPSFALTDEPARWERFRGPNGAGVSDDKNIPLTFGPKENLLWKTELPGVGNSSPIVWGQRLFLHTASRDGKLRSLLCIDTADGKILWQKDIPGATAKIRSDSSLASSTPTTDGKAVYVSFWNGKEVFLSAYDFAGELLWSKNLGVFNSQHGAGASPILYKDKVILANDMDKDDFTTKVPNARPSMLMAFDKRTGRLIWETARTAERACYSAPLLLRKPGKTELVVTSTTAVTGYDPENGTKLWEAKGWQTHAAKGPMRTVASPVLAGDILCVCAGGDAGRLAIGLNLGGPDAPQRAWDNRKDFPYISSPLARGEHIYFVNDKGVAGCYNARTGERVWFERVADSFYASPLLIDGKIYATTAAGEVHVLAAEPKFRQLARNALGEVVRATPAVADGRLYLRGERHLFCVGKSLLQGEPIKYQVTGLFMPERAADLREVVARLPGVKLVSVDFKNAEAVFDYDAKKFGKPQQAMQALNQMLGQASQGAFGIKPLCTTPADKLTLIEIRVAGLDCKACSYAAYEAVYKLDGVERATASFRDGKVTAVIDPTRTDRAKLEAALKKRGVQIK